MESQDGRQSAALPMNEPLAQPSTASSIAVSDAHHPETSGQQVPQKVRTYLGSAPPYRSQQVVDFGCSHLHAQHPHWSRPIYQSPPELGERKRERPQAHYHPELDPRIAQHAYQTALKGISVAQHRALETTQGEAPPSQYIERHKNGISKAPVSMEATAQHMEAIGWRLATAFGANGSPDSLFTSPHGKAEVKSRLKRLARPIQDKLHSLSKVVKHNMDEVQRNHVIGLCAASEENRDVVANSEFVLFEDCYPSKGPAAENPFLNSSNSTPNGNWTNKLLYGRVSARYADSYDVQTMHTFNSLGPSEVVAEDEQKNWVEVLDLNKHGSKLEPNRHDVLFAKGVGGCPQKRSYLCIIPKNIPYHNPMIPVAGELLPRSSATLDIMQNVAHTVRIEERRSRTAAMLAKAECDMSEEDMRSIERRFMTHYRGSVLDATKSSIKSAKVLSAEPHHSSQALEGRSLIPTRSDEQTIIAENAHEPSLPQYRATLSAPPVPDAVASHRASRPAEVRPTNDRPYGKAHHGPSGGRPHTRGPHRASRSTDTGFASDMNHLGLRTTQESLQSLTSSQTPGMYPARQARNSRPDNGVQAGKKRKRR